MSFAEEVSSIFKLIEEKEYEKALEKIENLLTVYNGLGELWSLKGIILVNLERFKQAVDAFLNAEKFNAKNDRLLLSHFGYALFSIGKYSEAVEKFRRSLEIEDDPNIRALTILALLKEKKNREACEEYRKLVEKWPKFKDLDLLRRDLENLC
ncbi:MAG: tetratricopeptide repeat protein [Candidatus Njordarchaeia archaeon]